MKLFVAQSRPRNFIILLQARERRGALIYAVLNPVRASLAEVLTSAGVDDTGLLSVCETGTRMPVRPASVSGMRSATFPSPSTSLAGTGRCLGHGVAHRHQSHVVVSEASVAPYLRADPAVSKLLVIGREFRRWQTRTSLAPMLHTTSPCVRARLACATNIPQGTPTPHRGSALQSGDEGRTIDGPTEPARVRGD